MSDFSEAIQHEFSRNSHKENAIAQSQYMKNKFAFYGLKSPLRKKIQKPFLVKKFLPRKDDLEDIVKELWLKPQRELHYFSQELVYQYANQFEKHDIVLFEFMIVTNSWWDTIDFISPKILAAYFKKYPDQIDIYIDKWLKSNHIWLQRSAILFQLKFKEQLDTKLLSSSITQLQGSNEFFINKAIGWVLREYGKTNPDWVINFVSTSNLSPLSQREALRIINKI